ncbi:hypothetical protein B0H16DRAFT_1895189 [Mycena metata]|uniref:Uncharacterized protein n=1 Tax=Mycena metata TaxID=1033252 RepID=A0AAD7HQ09_9AGAR|nr:hypothetical protein B0H16DRAFT_1895189 [Mycena metata]
MSQPISWTLFLISFSPSLLKKQLYDPHYFWDEKCSRGARLLALSTTYRCIRERANLRIFREVSNLTKGAPDSAVWPEAIWPFIVQVTLQDSSARHPNPVTLSTDLFVALPRMSSLNKVVLRLNILIPSQLILALSSVPQLSSLEILQARLDGPLPPLTLGSFPSLDTLLICVWKFIAVIPVRDVVRDVEFDNVIALLQSISGKLSTLSISGDLLSPEFLQIH